MNFSSSKIDQPNLYKITLILREKSKNRILKKIVSITPLKYNTFLRSHQNN